VLFVEEINFVAQLVGSVLEPAHFCLQLVALGADARQLVTLGVDSRLSVLALLA
jgi:hypothetical protein